MPEENLQACSYHIIRYTPNLIRDEWVNIGVLLLDSRQGRVLRRVIEEPGEFARVRRLHPAADEELLRRLSADFETQFAGGLVNGEDAVARLKRLEQTLSTTIQLSPQRGLLAQDPESELERLYREHVEPPRGSRISEELSTRNSIRQRANEVFRATGIWPYFERRVHVDEFTYAGDPMRLDYAYQRNGTRGFVQALPLARDPGQAKVLAFTADAIREKLANSEFLAVTETEPRPEENSRHRFMLGLLAERGISVLPLAQLGDWAEQVRPTLRQSRN